MTPRPGYAGQRSAVADQEVVGFMPTEVGTLVREVIFLVVVALSVALLVKTLVLQLYVVPSGSMEDTLQVGDKIAVARMWPAPLPPGDGDIVVFRDPDHWLPPEPEAEETAAVSALTFVGLVPRDAGHHLVKRVIGRGGDRIQCFGDGPVYRNGTPLAEDYIAPGSRPCDRQLDIEIPDGFLFVMGDNRENSADSRFNLDDRFGGLVPVSYVIGRVVAVVWPPSGIGLH